MARIFRSRKPLKVVTEYSSLELSWEYHGWLFEQYGFCHSEDNNQFVVAVYSMTGFSEDHGYNVGRLDHFECLYCGGMLYLDDEEPTWK